MGRGFPVGDKSLMQQYREVKDRHPNALVLFRVGDFFELFEADAETAARVLGLALTSRDRGTPMAGFPHHAQDAGLLRAAAPASSHTARPDWTFEPSTARAALFRTFKVLTPAGFGFDDRQPCLSAAGALLLYLQDTCKAGLAHLRRPRPYRAEGHLTLDEVTRRSLELTRTLREGNREGSLLSFLDRTVTPMGARLL